MRQGPCDRDALTLSAGQAAAAFLNDGVVAYLMADYEKAFSTMQSLAETSDHGYAQYYMAIMYFDRQTINWISKL